MSQSTNVLLEAPRPCIKTRFLILSDTHSALPDPDNQPDLHFSKPFPPADVAIHCGDLTSTGKIEEHRRALQLLKSLTAPLKLVIPGNHDLTLDREYCKEHPLLHGWTRPHYEQDLKEAYALYTNEEAKQAGIIYLVHGSHTLTLPNAAKLTVFVSSYTPEFYDWAFAYPRETDMFNADNGREPKFPVCEFDSDDIHDELERNECMVMVTHGPPRGALDKTTRGEDVGCDHLMTAVSRCRPLLHCFGHIHEGWGSKRKQWPWPPEDKKIESLKGLIKLGEEVVRGHRMTGEAREAHKKWQDEKQQMLSARKEVSESKIRYADEQRVVEAREAEPMILTEEQQQSVGYIDATAVKHGLETVFVNASIMDVHYNPVQRPWVVDLMLPAATELKKQDPASTTNAIRNPEATIEVLNVAEEIEKLRAELRSLGARSNEVIRNNP